MRCGRGAERLRADTPAQVSFAASRPRRRRRRDFHQHPELGVKAGALKNPDVRQTHRAVPLNGVDPIVIGAPSVPAF